MTPREAVKKAAAAFRQAGIPDPEIDAALLLSHLTGLAPLALRLDTDTVLAEDTLAAYDALCRKRMERVPLQYMFGSQEFMGHTFYVDERVLIPRPETELLCERAVSALEAKAAPRALDMCCGSGCLCVSIALACPHAEMHGADLSEGALAVTRMNADTLGANVTLHQGDLFSSVANEQFDVIVSNPPYIPSAECLTLQEEVRQEPLMALDGGNTGLDFYERIAHDAPAHLLPGGVLLLEVGWNQGETVRQLLENAGFTDTAVHQDYNGIGRMVEGHWHGVTQHA